LDFYNASSLKQQPAGRHIAPLGLIISIPNQRVLLLEAVWVTMKQQIPVS